MNRIVVIFRWLFTPPGTPGAAGSIGWWEARRVPVNLIIGAYGFVCLLVFFAAISACGTLQPGEDAVEPAALFLVPIVFNVCYTLGWLVEAPARLVVPDLSPVRPGVTIRRPRVLAVRDQPPRGHLGGLPMRSPY